MTTTNPMYTPDDLYPYSGTELEPSETIAIGRKT
jgi:hypothetical protein